MINEMLQSTNCKRLVRSKIRFGNFKDENDAESGEDEMEDFGIIDELGRLNTAENNNPAVDVNDENSNSMLW